MHRNRFTVLCLSSVTLLTAVLAFDASPPPPPAAPASTAPPAATAGPGAGTAGPATVGGTAEARLSEATALAAAGKFKEAIAKLEALRRDPACPPRAVALLGALYLKVNRPKEALEVLRPLAEPADAQPAVLYNAGLAALALHEVPVAEGYLGRAGGAKRRRRRRRRERGGGARRGRGGAC